MSTGLQLNRGPNHMPPKGGASRGVSSRLTVSVAARRRRPSAAALRGRFGGHAARGAWRHRQPVLAGGGGSGSPGVGGWRGVGPRRVGLWFCRRVDTDSILSYCQYGLNRFPASRSCLLLPARCSSTLLSSASAYAPRGRSCGCGLCRRLGRRRCPSYKKFTTAEIVF